MIWRVSGRIRWLANALRLLITTHLLLGIIERFSIGVALQPRFQLIETTDTSVGLFLIGADILLFVLMLKIDSRRGPIFVAVYAAIAILVAVNNGSEAWARALAIGILAACLVCLERRVTY